MRNADRIIVLESGQIVEEGSPEELLAKADGKFYRMYNDQKLDSLAVETLAVNPRARAKVSLAAHFSMAPSDFMVRPQFTRSLIFQLLLKVYNKIYREF